MKIELKKDKYTKIKNNFLILYDLIGDLPRGSHVWDMYDIKMQLGDCSIQRSHSQTGTYEIQFDKYIFLGRSTLFVLDMTFNDDTNAVVVNFKRKRNVDMKKVFNELAKALMGNKKEHEAEILEILESLSF